MKKILGGILLLVALVFAGLWGFSRIVEGSHLIPNEALEQQGRPILVDRYLDTEVWTQGEEVYMAYEGVKAYFAPEIQVDLEERRFTLTPDLEGYQFEVPRLNDRIKVNETKLNFKLKEFDGQLAVPIKSLGKWLGIEVTQGEESGIVIIDWLQDPLEDGKILAETYLLDTPSWLGKRKLPLAPGTQVKILDTQGDYLYLRTSQGYMGYVPREDVSLEGKHGTTPYYYFEKNRAQLPPGPIGLVWDHVNEYTKDRSQEERLEAIDVISPTWFRLMDAEGNLENKGDFQYVRDMQGKGYQIWGLVTNSFDPQLTSEFLADPDAQEAFIRQILIYSGLYQLNGINIDFENVYYRDQGALTAFVAKLTDVLHENQMVVSMDMTVPSTSPNWSMVYDRAALGKIVDYVAVMTYDEHWASSPKSGSVASIGWVERGIENTLKLIPAEKVLLGMPFYTRLWEEETLGNGKVKVSSKAYGMAKIRELLAENQGTILWDEKAGQYYGEYQLEGKTYRVWLEDSRSLALKATLIDRYGLAGMAAWRKDFETPEVWDALYQMVKAGGSYTEIVQRVEGN